MKIVYAVLGICAIVVGIMSFCGFEMTPVAAGCYAITTGIAFLNESDRMK